MLCADICIAPIYSKGKTAPPFDHYNHFSLQQKTMKRVLTLLLTLCLTAVASAQTVIDVTFEQYPPLRAVAQTVSVEVPAEGITLGSDVTVDGGDGSYSYLWTNADGETLSTEKTLVITRPGDYYLTVSDGHHCQVSVHFTATGADAIGSLTTDGLRQVRIFTVAGTLILKTSATTDYARQLAEGVYVVCFIYSDGHEAIRKVTVKK